MLVMFICSAAAQNCIPPITSPELFEDEYSCMMAGYTTAASMTQDMGREEVNKHKKRSYKPYNRQGRKQ